ncbi:hypothetical protein [Luteimonas sp. e5]
MARYRPRRPLHWQRIYQWAHPSHRWNVWRDVLLEAQPWTQRPEAVRAAVRDWLGGMQVETIEVDGERIEVAASGGIWVQAEDFAGGQPAMSIQLHSSGEDAFDSLKWHADALVDVLLQADPDIKVKWVRHPHRRHYLRQTTR